MDEREAYQRDVIIVPENEEKNIEEKNIEEQSSEGKSKKKWIILSAALLAVLIVIGIAAGLMLSDSSPKGYENYTVQKEQYYVEYSDEYDYWDVLTVEYPKLSGIDDEMQTQINQLLYDTAMDRVNYWHLEPSDDVKVFQEEHFSIFASDVNCDVTYHSQYLLSVDYKEYYSAGNPVWMTTGTERAVTLDLLTGQSYKLEDILEINEDFVRLWDKSLCDSLGGGDYINDDDVELVLSWFLQNGDPDYFFHTFFYITKDKEFGIGFAADPVLDGAITYKPIDRSLCTQLSIEELEDFKKQSDFWDKYEKSESTGEVLPCADKKENIWLGESAGIWNR